MKRALSIILSILMAFSAFSVMPFTAMADGEYEVSVTSNDSHGGTFSGGGTYRQGQEVTLTATPYEGYVFECWTVNNDSEWRSHDPEIKVTADRNKVYTALFWKVLVTLEQDHFIYSGNPIEPMIDSVVLQGVDYLFVQGVDYRVSYSDNYHAGDAKAVFEFIRNFTGYATVKYTIHEARLTVTALSAEREYNGKPLTAGHESSPLIDGDRILNVNNTSSQTDVGSCANIIEGVTIENKNGEEVRRLCLILKRQG